MSFDAHKHSNEPSRRLGAEQLEMPNHVQVVLEDLSAMAMAVIVGCKYIVLPPTKKT